MCIISKDDTDSAEVGEIESKTTHVQDIPKDESTAKEGSKDEVLIGKEGSFVKEKEASKEKIPTSSLSRENSMEESLLCGICQVSMHACTYIISITVCTCVYINAY